MRYSIIDRDISEEEQEILDRLDTMVPERLLRGGPTSTFMDAIEAICIEARRRVYAREAEIHERRRLTANLKRLDEEPIIVSWCKKNITAGEIVKMKGCRDGSGIRRVTHTYSNNGYGLVCEQLGVYGPKDDRRIRFRESEFEVMGITEHMWNKITHIATVHHDTGRYELSPIKEFIPELVDAGEIVNG